MSQQLKEHAFETNPELLNDNLSQEQVLDNDPGYQEFLNNLDKEQENEHK